MRVRQTFFCWSGLTLVDTELFLLIIYHGIIGNISIASDKAHMEVAIYNRQSKMLMLLGIFLTVGDWTESPRQSYCMYFPAKNEITSSKIGKLILLLLMICTPQTSTIARLLTTSQGPSQVRRGGKDGHPLAALSRGRVDHGHGRTLFATPRSFWQQSRS
jgi:hypothetical protein